MADSRLAGQSDEVLSDGSPNRRLAALNTESLTDATSPTRQLAALNTESLNNASNGSPVRQFGGISIEVLVPARLGYTGWGPPIKSPAWN